MSIKLDLYCDPSLELNSWVVYKESWFMISDDEFESLRSIMPTIPHQVRMPNGLVNLPRMQLCFGQSYSYSGTTSHALHDFPPVIVRALDQVNKHWMKSTNTTEPIYSMCLVNYYRDGNDYIGQHSDDTRQMIPGTPIYSISLGASRKFKLAIKPKYKQSHVLTKIDEYTIVPDHSSVLIMGGSCQQTHTHSVIKQPKITDLRINLTFRAFKK
jgi:alkylated DNA repair dioxygenase AlkB